MNRIEYFGKCLDRSDLSDDPIQMTADWIEQVRSGGIAEPEAMCLSTVDGAGQPSSRMVLMRGLSQRGLVFYTNYNSLKAHEIRENPQVACHFFWPQLHRQIRIRGVASLLTGQESDAYFASRPRTSQLSAHASQQSEVIVDRDFLETRMRQVENRYPDEVPRPTNWGGYLVAPSEFEFWQGRPSRLHDRFRYRMEEGVWLIERLAP